MNYFGGPITLSPTETAMLLAIVAVILLVIIAVVYLIAFSIYKTVKINRAARTNPNMHNNRRTLLTIALPVIAVFSLIMWLLTSMATHGDRYAPQGYPSISSALGYVTIGLFVATILTALYYSVKK